MNRMAYVCMYVSFPWLGIFVSVHEKKSLIVKNLVFFSPDIAWIGRWKLYENDNMHAFPKTKTIRSKTHFLVHVHIDPYRLSEKNLKNIGRIQFYAGWVLIMLPFFF